MAVIQDLTVGNGQKANGKLLGTPEGFLHSAYDSKGDSVVGRHSRSIQALAGISLTWLCQN